MENQKGGQSLSQRPHPAFQAPPTSSTLRGAGSASRGPVPAVLTVVSFAETPFEAVVSLAAVQQSAGFCGTPSSNAAARSLRGCGCPRPSKHCGGEAGEWVGQSARGKQSAFFSKASLSFPCAAGWRSTAGLLVLFSAGCQSGPWNQRSQKVTHTHRTRGSSHEVHSGNCALLSSPDPLADRAGGFLRLQWVRQGY